MPYTAAIYEGERAREFASQRKPLGLGIPDEETALIAKIVWEASSFTDPGADWNRFHLYAADGRHLGTRHSDGY